jgi:arylsulfatase A-like enzyme
MLRAVRAWVWRAAAVSPILAVTACGGRTHRPPFERLTPAGRAVETLRLDDETRPAVRLRPGETLKLSTAGRGRLRFALGYVDPPERGFLYLTVRAGGREVHAERFSVARQTRWWRRSVEVGAAPVEIQTRYAAVPETSPAPDHAWVALSVPRLYRAAANATRRTLLWISQDALRADHLSAYGYSRRTSPHFDRRAAEWGVFEDATATSSWTLPSLASQFTSRWPTFHGAILHSLPVGDGLPSVFERLAEAGFTVVGVTGNVLVDAEHGLARGFDALRYVDGRAFRLNEALLELVEECGAGDLAVFVHYMDPHAPYVPPRPFDRRFGAPRGLVKGTDYESLRRLRDPEARAEVVALYDGDVAAADEGIAGLFENLETRGVLDARTLIAYTADHGEELFDHGSWHHGGSLYQEVVRVPLAVRVPGQTGRRIRTPISLVDLAPTMLDAFGLPRPPSFQGRSLLPLLRGEPLPEEPLYAETGLRARQNQLLAIREGALKLILEVPGGRETAPPVLAEEAYDLAADPAERTNRAGQPEFEPLRQRARAYLARARAEAPAMRPVELDPASLEKLRALGYIR